jgi:FliI/YscN family ATPase
LDSGPRLTGSGGFYPLFAAPPRPLDRENIEEPLITGVRAIDMLLPCGRGQRVGLFGGSGVGKSTLLGAMSRHSAADVSIVALIGERNREVRSFIEHDLGPDGLKKSVVVVATSDRPAPVRVRACFLALAAAEYFRDQGANVLLVMDSVTRLAMAQREIGLAGGEPPTQKGYTPSVFSLLPRIFERAGNFKKGSITASSRSWWTATISTSRSRMRSADCSTGTSCSRANSHRRVTIRPSTFCIPSAAWNRKSVRASNAPRR